MHPPEAPKVLHYGLRWDILAPGTPVPVYTFDKHWHFEFMATRCPPWDLEGKHDDAKGGLFPHPPRASDFKTSVTLHHHPPPPSSTPDVLRHCRDDNVAVSPPGRTITRRKGIS